MAEITQILTQDDYQFSEDETIDLVMNTNILDAIFTHYPPEDLFEMIKEKVAKPKADQFFTYEDVVARGLKEWSGTVVDMQALLAQYPDLGEVLQDPSEDIQHHLKTLNLEWLLEVTDTDNLDLINHLKRQYLHCLDTKDFIEQVLNDPERAMIPTR
ncbi:sulfate reductase [Pseudoalteromonas phage KB12-38]|nr:sulfate reductase [Pseudoalteromonas phage KB12-38]